MNSQGTIRLVIAFLGLIALAIVAGGILLAFADKTLAAEFVGLGGVAIGAIGGMLSQTNSATEPQPVTVVNPPADPVPVEPARG